MSKPFYEIMSEAMEVYLSTLDEETLKNDRPALKRFKWFFLMGWPSVNNTKINVEEKEQ